ncbi:hypothetical protein FHY55_18515 [Oceanicola sp. D3]|uniref:hypothetical protein n=1 Tax=Oceanicola sp. D3 TaxID=2587163 RepID=UPI001124660C|nr:hypothetical protein [Oceanicola sp. D3]QDC11104.1 hypothetical protein FHY55_18515 [Oceanicola sp. D3]
MTETALALIYCSMFAMGDVEVRVPYNVGYDLHYVRVDCRTESHVIELGLDKRSSIDSVHQAVFAATQTGLTPKVVMIDTDGREDAYEFQVRTVAQQLGVAYEVVDANYLIRWQMTQYLRNYPRPSGPGGS